MEPGAPGVEVVAHAERLRVSTRRVAAERVRVTKRIVTTTRTVEVPVRVEQLVLSHEPLPGGTPVVGGATTPRGEDLVLVLHEEVPEVVLRVVPVERVVVGVRTVEGEQTLAADLRTEQVVVDVDATAPPARTGPSA